MSRMDALYTETLEELLENQNYGKDNENPSLTEILTLMGNFPAFVFEDIELNFIDMFLHRYDIREIGAETEELFLHFWRDRTEELLVKFVPRIKMWMDNFNDLFKFTVKLDTSESQKYSNGKQETYYINPITAQTGITKTVVVDEENNTTTTTFSGGNLKTEDVSTSDNLGQRNRELSRDVLQSVWGKTRPIILKQIMELEDIYNSAIREYNTIFMGVY